jgi:hypothetical protein
MTPRTAPVSRALGLTIVLAVAAWPAAAQTAPSAPAAAPTPAAAQKPALDRHGMPEKMSGEEIRAAWFDGKPFVATSPDGTAYRMIFTPDGKAARVAVVGKRPKTVTGFWRTIAEGYCSRWSGSNREKCFNVRPSEDGTETIVRFGQQIAGTWRRP